MLVVFCRCDERFIRCLRAQNRLAFSEYFGHRVVLLNPQRKPAALLHQQCIFHRICMGMRNGVNLVLFQKIHNAIVGEGRYREARHMLQCLLVIER